MAVNLFKLKKMEKSNLCYRKAFELIESYLNKEDNDVFVCASVTNHLAWTLTELGDLENALKYYKEAEKRIKYILGDCHLNVANLLSNMGVTYFNCEKFEESLDCHKEAY